MQGVGQLLVPLAPRQHQFSSATSDCQRDADAKSVLHAYITHTQIYIYTHVRIYLSICLSVCLSIYLSTYPMLPANQCYIHFSPKMWLILWQVVSSAWHIVGPVNCPGPQVGMVCLYMFGLLGSSFSGCKWHGEVPQDN
jgi:hypothetical protein